MLHQAWTGKAFLEEEVVELVYKLTQMFFLLLVCVLFSKTPYLFIVVGAIDGWEGIKMVSANTKSVNEPARTSF